MSDRILVTLLDQAARGKGYGYSADLSEAFRHLRTNIEFSNFEKKIKVISIVSAKPTEGKSTVAANLAVVMAGQHPRVLLIDCDLRKPVVHKMFHASNKSGLSNLLLESSFEPGVFNNYCQQIIHPNITNELFLITSGPVVPNPSEMLSSKKFKDLVASLRNHFDIIILDGPPVLPVPDSIPIGLTADGTLFVIASEQTEKEAAQIAVTTLRRSNVNLLGTVLTMIKKESSSYQYSYTAYRETHPKKSVFKKKKEKLD